MIIVEGPDGAGKSHLVQKLSAELHLPVHERASHGVEGPIANHYDWAHRDVVTMADQELAIYDRHPLISEYIYGPICRGILPPAFATSNAHVLVRMMAPRVLVVLCRPPNERLKSSVSVQRDMPGVTENVERIAAAYDAMRIFWPGRVVTYDYTAGPDDLNLVMAACRIQAATERSKRMHPSNRRRT